MTLWNFLVLMLFLLLMRLYKVIAVQYVLCILLRVRFSWTKVLFYSDTELTAFDRFRLLGGNETASGNVLEGGVGWTIENRISVN